MKTKLSLGYFMLLLFVLLLTTSSSAGNNGSFKGYQYKDNVPSIIFAIKQTITGKTPQEGPKIMDQWIEHIQKKKNIVKTNDERNKLLAYCYRQKADAYNHLQAVDLALENYNHSLKLDSTEINTYFNRAALYSSTDEYDKAIKEFEKIIEKRPDFGDAYFAIGQIYDQQKNYVEAINYYNKAIAINDKRQDYKDNKTVAYMTLLRLENNSEDVLALKDANPQDVGAYELSGNTHYMKGEYEEAIKDFTQAINLDPQAGYYSLRGYCYFTLKKYEEAESDFTKVIELSGEYGGMAYSIRASVYHAMNDNEKAMVDYNEGIRLMPTSPVVYTMRGDFYISLGQYKKGIDDYSKAIDIYAYSDYYKIRGEAYKKLGMETQAKNDFVKASELELKNKNSK